MTKPPAAPGVKMGVIIVLVIGCIAAWIIIAYIISLMIGAW